MEKKGGNFTSFALLFSLSPKAASDTVGFTIMSLNSWVNMNSKTFERVDVCCSENWIARISYPREMVKQNVTNLSDRHQCRILDLRLSIFVLSGLSLFSFHWAYLNREIRKVSPLLLLFILSKHRAQIAQSTNKIIWPFLKFETCIKIQIQMHSFLCDTQVINARVYS